MSGVAPTEVTSGSNDAKYGPSYFARRYICNLKRVCGAFWAVANLGLVLMVFNMTPIYVFEAFFVSLYFLLLLALMNLIHKKLFCRVSAIDMVWPGLHIMIYSMLFFALLIRSMYFIYVPLLVPDELLIEVEYALYNNATYSPYGYGLNTGGYYFYIWIALLYLFACYQDVIIRGILRSSGKGIEDFQQSAIELLQSKPKVTIHGEAYHYETRTRQVTDSEGRSSTETYQEKVTTATEAWNFEYQDFTLIGPAFSAESFAQWKSVVILFSIVSYTEVADQYTLQLIKKEKARMYDHMSNRDTHASASYSLGDQSQEFCLYPFEGKENNETCALITKVICVLLCLSGLAFPFLCVFGMFAVNPERSYVKEITAKQQELQQVSGAPGHHGMNFNNPNQPAPYPRSPQGVGPGPAHIVQMTPSSQYQLRPQQQQPIPGSL